MNKIITAIVLVGLALLIGCNAFMSKEKVEAPQYLSELQVKLVDWNIQPVEMYAKAGEVKFVVTNEGMRRYEFQVGEYVEQKLLINANNTSELVLNLAPGDYKVFSPMQGHEKAGMIATLHVA